MRYGFRLRDILYTLRFRLVLWTTLVVFVMVVATNVAVREVEQHALIHSYDQFLMDSMEDVNLMVARLESRPAARLARELSDKVKANKNRSLFIQLYDSDRKLIWGNDDAPPLPPPIFEGDFKGPFDGDEKKHRVFERKLFPPSGDVYIARCGFLQSELLEDVAVLNRAILLASISILLAAPLGAYLIAMRATRPISQIIATTAHLQPSNLNERLPIRGTGDELDQLSATINSMLDRLARHIDQNRDFVANAAHELRSPLAAIRSSVEVALNRSRSPEEYAAVLADVTEEIGRLGGLVNRLLILAEGDAGRLAGRNQVTRLDKIVRESVDMFGAVAELQGVQLTAAELTSAMVPGDEFHLRQVVRNLIDNAIKYNRNPGSVTVRLSTDKSSAILTVEDTGVGIDRDVEPRIFERFYRADKARSRETDCAGYGLGLSICQSIVRALDGEISVTSQPGVGSTFTVRLPLAFQPVADHAPPVHA
ncbi:MAG TPA: HAMP domain-containing sensor histidine kinase [Gemmataceae bacterium]|nr:HAMP domain-containing sensor histidine kinase [Gemmataceae bacterium]